MLSIGIIGVKTNAAKSLRKFVAIFDKYSTFHSHISAVCSSCFPHIWHLRYLDLDNVELLASAFVSSCLDYCNSFLAGIANTDLAKLPCVQNRPSSILTKLLLFTPSATLLHFLQWFPVKFRILFKISLLTYTSLCERQAAYLPLIVCSTTHVPFTEIKQRNHSVSPYLLCPFSPEQPLPSAHSTTSIATSKKHLKTHLFDVVFPPSTLARPMAC